MSSPDAPAALCVGLFVGGRARRCGGFPKGNLRVHDGRTILGRLSDVVRTALPDAPLVLVGEASAYSGLCLPTLPDAPAGIGPLGGLHAVLEHAERSGHSAVLALAADMPLLGVELVRRLATVMPEALAVAPRAEGDRWHALTARYSVRALPFVRAAIDDGEHALQRLFARLGASAAALPVAPAEHAELTDWDRPEDRAARS